MAIHQEELRPVSRVHAARAFHVCAGLDPDGLETPESAANAGYCFELCRFTGRGIFSCGVRGADLWCFAAAATGQGMTAAGLDVLERMARRAGCARVVFQTMRRGLIRRTAAHGYQIICTTGRGFVLAKNLTES